MIPNQMIPEIISIETAQQYANLSILAIQANNYFINNPERQTITYAALMQHYNLPVVMDPVVMEGGKRASKKKKTRASKSSQNGGKKNTKTKRAKKGTRKLKKGSARK
jgi:hypothetical protein